MLLFQSLQEAEMSLGRNLSYAETLYFNYTAKMPDYWIYCHNILFLFLIFTFAPLPVALIDLMAPKFVQKYKLQPRIKFTAREVVECYKKVMMSFVFVVGPLQLTSFPMIKAVGIRTSLPLPSMREVLLQLLVYFLVEDYTNYWIHRLMHSKWGYEKIHYRHHEFEAPIGFAAPYAHWAEILLLGIPAFLGPAIVPGHMLTFIFWIGIRQMEAIETHSGYDFPWSLTKFVPFYGGPEYHDYHHFVGGQSQSNFASVFTYCDYIYGTDKGYRYQKHQLAKLREAYSEAADGEDKKIKDMKSQ